jgi:hypothetical protein
MCNRSGVQIVCGRAKFDRVCHELPDSTPPRLATRWSGPPVRSSLVAARPPGDASVHRGARVRCGAGRSAKILDDFGFAESFVDPRAHKSPLSQNFPRKVSLARNTCGRREGRRVRDRRDSKGTAGAEDPGDQSGSGPLSRAIGGRIECLAYPVEPLTRRRGAATGKAGPYPLGGRFGELVGEASGLVGVDRDAGAHRRGERDLLQVPALGRGGLEPDHLVDGGRVVLKQGRGRE